MLVFNDMQKKGCESKQFFKSFYFNLRCMEGNMFVQIKFCKLNQKHFFSFYEIETLHTYSLLMTIFKYDKHDWIQKRLHLTDLLNCGQHKHVILYLHSTMLVNIKVKHHKAAAPGVGSIEYLLNGEHHKYTCTCDFLGFRIFK